MVWTRNKIIGISAGGVILLAILIWVAWMIFKPAPPTASPPPVAAPASNGGGTTSPGGGASSQGERRRPSGFLADATRNEKGDVCTVSTQGGQLIADFLRADHNPFGVVAESGWECKCQRDRLVRLINSGVNVWGVPEAELIRRSPETTCKAVLAFAD